MELNVELVKALEPGKIYALKIEDRVDLKYVSEFCESVEHEFDIRFIILGPYYDIVSCPEGYEFKKKEE